MRYRYSGFTLVEMMITVAILGILMAIAVPSYQYYVTESWETRATTALQENVLFMEKINSRFYGYTKTRDRETRKANRIISANLPIRALCTGSDCGRNYQFGVAVSDDLSQYILVAYPTGTQASSSECGAFVVDSTGRKYAKYVSSGSYSMPTISENSYSAPSQLFGGVDKSSECF